MSFDRDQHQRDRIRDLEQHVAGLQLLRDHLIHILAGVVCDYQAKLEIQALTQDEFMQLLAELEQDRQAHTA